MKKISIFAGFILLSFMAMAQAKSVQGIAEYQKSKLPAAVIELPYAPSTIEAAMEEHFNKKGHKSASSKDYKVYRNVELGGYDRYDAYLKVERKSRKEKEAAVVYMVVTRPNELITAKLGSDQAGVNDAREFLDNLVPDVEEHQLKLDILAQEDVIKKAEKKYNSLLSDSTDLYKKKQQLEEKIIENSQSLQSQQAELEKERLALEAIRQRRKG
jgi:hypothetical protein